jgi:hypothetical protein
MSQQGTPNQPQQGTPSQPQGTEPVPEAFVPGQAAEESEEGLLPNQPIVVAPGTAGPGPVPEHQQSQPGQAWPDARYQPNLDEEGQIVQGDVKAQPDDQPNDQPEPTNRNDQPQE